MGDMALEEEDTPNMSANSEAVEVEQRVEEKELAGATLPRLKDDPKRTPTPRLIRLWGMALAWTSGSIFLPLTT